jgi:DNA-binding GntR family transcriptional regulator
VDELSNNRQPLGNGGRGPAAGEGIGPVVVNQHLTKSTYAYQELRRMILEGELEPGTRLLLRNVAEQLGLSIQPIRDAIKMLERDGLVDTESHRGATVTQISVDAVIELISVRLWLEILAVEEAVPGHSEESLAAVKAAMASAEQILETQGDGLAYSQANRRLHEAIEAPAPPHLRDLIAYLWEQLWRARRRMSLFSLAPTSARAAQREHRALVAAVTRGDAEAAAAAMARHRESTLAAWRKALASLPAA